MTKAELYQMPVTALMAEPELYHFGVKGMQWGRRKARPVAGGVNRGGQKTTSPSDEAARKEARKQKAIKAAKIGAAVAGTALAAYGAYKVSRFVKNTKEIARMEDLKRVEWRTARLDGASWQAQQDLIRRYDKQIFEMRENRWR